MQSPSLPLRRLARFAVGGLVVPTLLILSLGGCAVGGTPSTGAARADGTPSEAKLRQAARSAMGGDGHVDVRVIDGVAYVTGEVETAIDEAAVLRAIERFEGIERVENGLRREM